MSEFNNTTVLAVSVSHEIKACLYKLAVVYTCLRPAAILQFPSGSEREQGGGVDRRPGQFNWKILGRAV